MFEGGLSYADIVEHLDTVDELNGRVAAAIRNTVPALRHLSVEAGRVRGVF
jgi:hypothetical protein